MCGEKDVVGIAYRSGHGSPPHVRGKESFVEHGFVIGGITPACAGKSQPAGAKATLKEDHPRMCGEK